MEFLVLCHFFVSVSSRNFLLDFLGALPFLGMCPSCPRVHAYENSNKTWLKQLLFFGNYAVACFDRCWVLISGVLLVSIVACLLSLLLLLFVQITMSATTGAFVISNV